MTPSTPALFDDGDLRWVGAWGLIAGVFAALAARIPLGGVAHVSDEVAYTLQARLFAGWMRTGPPADNATMLVYPFWTTDPVSYAPFPPGWPALLGAGEWFGAAWLVNPVLFAAVPVLVWMLARTWADRATARLSVVFAALSPGLWLLAGSRMAHTSVLVALGLVAVVATRAPRAPWTWLVGGLAAGFVVLARPYDAVLVAAPLLLIGARGASDWTRRSIWVLPPALAAVALLLDNAALTGEPLLFPMDLWFDQWMPERADCNRLGFGADVGCASTLGSVGHTPGKAFWLGIESLLRLDGLLFGIPGGMLVVAWGAMRLRPRWPWLLGLVLIVGYGLYWSPGRAYGARFYHPLYLILPIAIGAALVRLPKRWGLLCVVAATLIGSSRVAREVADRYWCVDDGLADLLSEQGIEEGVVFLQARGTRRTGWPLLGTSVFTCDPMLESGDGLQLNDPAHPGTGLRVRHALSSLAQTRAYMAAHHPGAAAWLIVHDVASDRRQVRSLGVVAPDEGG